MDNDFSLDGKQDLGNNLQSTTSNFTKITFKKAELGQILQNAKEIFNQTKATAKKISLVKNDEEIPSIVGTFYNYAYLTDHVILISDKMTIMTSSVYMDKLVRKKTRIVDQLADLGYSSHEINDIDSTILSLSK
jgi:hypothetical protein